MTYSQKVNKNIQIMKPFLIKKLCKLTKICSKNYLNKKGLLLLVNFNKEEINKKKTV